MRNLWISHEAIEKYGGDYFKNCDAFDFWNVEGTQDDGTVVNYDDMGNVYISLNDSDECFTNVNELRGKEL